MAKTGTKGTGKPGGGKGTGSGKPGGGRGIEKGEVKIGGDKGNSYTNGATKSGGGKSGKKK